MYTTIPLSLFAIKKVKEIKGDVVNNIHFFALLGYKSNVKFKTGKYF